MGIIVGIDLGTTNSVMATIDESGRPIVQYNDEGSNVTPSVVRFEEDGTIEVGSIAKRQLGLQPYVFGQFKRVMGTGKTFETPEGTVGPTELSTLVLKKMRQSLESKLGEIDEVVVTIPANFSNEAREATMASAKAAGLKVKFIINEPTAAALYYAYSTGEELSGTYAVYDMGGGTFDISIIRVVNSDVEVLVSNGVSELGGHDFDLALQRMVLEMHNTEFGTAADDTAYPLTDAEKEKHSLSLRNSTIAQVVSDAGRRNINIQRPEFEEAISSLLGKAEMLCEMTLEEAGLEPSDIDDVILVGGSTRVPLIRDSVARLFQKEPKSVPNVDEAVALGAALYAAYKSDSSKLTPAQEAAISKVKVQEATSKSYGTIALSFNKSRNQEELQNTVLIVKNTKIPATVQQSYFTVIDNQKEVRCCVTESTTPEKDPRFVRTVWEGSLPLPDDRKAGQEIRVSFGYDENQIMHCKFEDVESGKAIEVDLDMGNASNENKLDASKFTVR